MKLLINVAAALGIAVSAYAGEAAAQQVYCMNNGQMDPLKTQQLSQALQQPPNPQVAATMAGTWYTEIQSPQTGQVAYTWVTYQPNGVYDYQARVCSSMLCSDAYATGIYVGYPLGDGGISLLINYSSTSVDHACIGAVTRPFGNGMLQDSNGQVWRRVQ